MKRFQMTVVLRADKEAGYGMTERVEKVDVTTATEEQARRIACGRAQAVGDVISHFHSIAYVEV